MGDASVEVEVLADRICDDVSSNGCGLLEMIQGIDMSKIIFLDLDGI